MRACGTIPLAGVAFEGMRDRGFAFMVDISDRKRVEQQLWESNERFEIVAQTTSDAVWDWDLVSGNVVWSQSVHTLFGYLRSDVGSGYDAALRALAPDQAEKVVFLTAGAYTPTAQRFLEEVENTCLEKPFDPEELRTFTRNRIGSAGAASCPLRASAGSACG